MTTTYILNTPVQKQSSFLFLMFSPKNKNQHGCTLIFHSPFTRATEAGITGHLIYSTQLHLSNDLERELFWLQKQTCLCRVGWKYPLWSVWTMTSINSFLGSSRVLFNKILCSFCKWWSSLESKGRWIWLGLPYDGKVTVWGCIILQFHRCLLTLRRKKGTVTPPTPYIRLQTFLSANGQKYPFLQLYDLILRYETLQYFIGTSEDFYCQFL